MADGYPPPPPPREEIIGEEQTQEFTPSYMSTADPGLVQFQLHSEDILKTINKKLKHMGADEKFINELMIIIEPVTSRAIYLSDFEEEQVYTISYEINKAAIKTIFKYMGDHAERDSLIALVFAITFASLRRPYRGGERKFLGKTSQSKEVFQKVGQEKKKGGWKTLWAGW